MSEVILLTELTGYWDMIEREINDEEEEMSEVNLLPESTVGHWDRSERAGEKFLEGWDEWGESVDWIDCWLLWREGKEKIWREKTKKNEEMDQKTSWNSEQENEGENMFKQKK